jgi:hypothetical protein
MGIRDRRVCAQVCDRARSSIGPGTEQSALVGRTLELNAVWWNPPARRTRPGTTDSNGVAFLGMLLAAHTTLTPYLAVPLVVIGLVFTFVMRRRRR